ncbi:unnamed protein product [Triticum turgidum subsp. durum]|uniref:Uncharacterized protein n=1 Tax=Triticum turgidum subsp. durum TaxID=4567 RepID=A0A9R1PJK7_TRITD|nr:unnamed protein product [Triticum turgidum subsp. durum]
MQLRFLPFAASAVAGRSFLAAIPRPVTERRTHLRCNAGNSSSSSEDEGGELSAAEEALRRLAELDAQLEGLKEPKMRPPPPPPPPGNHFLFPPRSPRAKLPASPVFHASMLPCPPIQSVV